MRLLHSITLAALLLSCGSGDSHPPPTHGRRQHEAASDGKPELLEIVLDGPPTEQNDGTLFGAPAPLLRTVIDRIDGARTDAHAKGIFLRVGPLGGAYARAADLRRAIAAFRRAHKPVHCHFDVADNASYALLASSCDRISMTPAGELALVGVGAQLFFAKRLLDNIGVRADLMQIGRFKGAEEPLTREDASPELRQSMGLMLDDLESSLTESIGTGRHLDATAVQALVDAGPYDGREAFAARLIDAVAFDDEARAAAKTAAHAERVVTVSLDDDAAAFDFDAFLRALSGETEHQLAPHEARVALVVLTGEISDGEEGRGSGASDPFVRELRRLADDRDVKAVVVRIDSPGGSALASDRMWHAVRRVAGRKPVVVSVGDMAASGGYYIACAATEIFAEDTSLVGSIGVVGGKVVVAELARRIGISGEVLARGAHAGWSGPLAPFTDDERAIVSRQMRATYDRFLGRVALGRHLDATRLDAAAEGRIWSGRRARTMGLVDSEGGLSDALARARTLGHVGARAPLTVWPPQRTPMERIAHLLGASGGDDARTPLPSLLDALTRVSPDLAAIADGGALFLPLLGGREHTIVALPLVLDLR